MVERQDIGARARFAIFAAGLFSWVFALAATRDVDFAALLGGVSEPWRSILLAPFQGPLLPFCLALCAGLGMVMLVTEAPQRLRIYGALLSFTAPMYAAARLLATA